MKKIFNFMLLFVALTHCMQAKVLYVKQGSTGDGSSWNQAYGSVADAIATAAAGDMIYVATGTYTNTWGKPKAGVSLYGGFAGNESSISERDMASSAPYDFRNETVITVENGQVLNVAASLGDTDAVNIDGFSFRGCTNNNSIMILRGGIHVSNCRFIDNKTTLAATPPGTNNLVLFNMTATTGVDVLNASIINCLFEGNCNEQNQNILGVRAEAANSTVVIDGCIFRNNETNLASGSTNANILLAAGNNGFTSIRNCQIYNNSSKQAALSAAVNSEVVNCMIYNNDCGTNNVLLAGKMYNSMVVNNSSRFCFNNNNAGLYNSIVAGNKTAGLAINNTNYTTFEGKNSVIDKATPSVGIYDAMQEIENVADARFVKPTSFVGKAANAAQEAELNVCDWNIIASSPLLNTGLASHFTSSRYGVAHNVDITGKQVRYYGANTDINALEAEKLLLKIELGEGGEPANNQTGYYMNGQQLALSVTPQAGYRIKEWKDQSGQVIATTAAFDYTMPATAQTLTVTFSKTDTQYNLTVVAGEGGTVQNVSGTYFPDQVIELNATPNIGYEFARWTDGSDATLSTSPTYSYTMPEGDMTVTAHFALKADDAPDGHQFDFEGLEINAQWKALHGNLSISDDRSQTGTQSLCWTTLPQQQNVLRIDLVNTYLTATQVTCYFNLYNTQAFRDGTLEVNFYSANGTQVRKATQSMNFIGWREFERRYGTDFSQKAPTNRVAYIELVLNNPDATATKIFIDRVNLQGTLGGNKYATDWSAPDATIFTGEAMLKEYALIADPILPFEVPTTDEKVGLALIKSRNPITLRAGNIDAARKFVRDLNISRNSDGTIKAKYTPLRDCGLVETTTIIEVLTRVEALGYAAQTSADDKQLLTDYLDYIFDQDYLFRTTSFAASDYTLVRNLGSSFVYAFKACESQRHQTAMLSLMQWVFAYGHLYRADYLTSQNSDVIHNYIAYYLQIIANIDDKTTAVRELKGFKRYLDRASEYTPGSSGLLKPDGSGFHHSTHYPNYMYSYRGWIDAWHATRGTVFSAEGDSYDRFKNAVMMMCKLSTRGSSANFLANSMGGRNPFAAGIRLVLSKPYLTKLSEIGGDINQTPSDKEVDQFSAYMFDAGSSSDEFDGFYAYNWSPAGVYRFGNWVATMRAPTTKFWGAEIYSSRNRFGRYQSHGTLEVLYNNQTAPSGYPSANNESGWDWNVVPGGTTVHYTSWNEMMPNKNTSQRFDQYARTKNFSGALSMGDCGVFASDFDQIDTWSINCFAATGLAFKKSVFAFDGKLISLGSNISSTSAPSNTGITATNLFQSYKPATAPVVQGSQLSQNQDLKEYTGANWVLTPEKTGYYVPSSNDKLVVFYGTQSSPIDDASNVNTPGSALAAKAYINHGVTPTNKNYHFVVVPGTDAAQMQTIATQIAEDGGELYTIHAQDETLHSITYKPLNTTAYAFFAAKSDISFGKITAVGSEMLVMQKTVSDNELSFAVCNPDLRPQNTTYGWTATTTHTSITLAGEWNLVSATSADVVVSAHDGATHITLALTDGMPIHFDLEAVGSGTGIETAPQTAASQVWAEQGEVHIVSNQLSEASIYDSAGMPILVTGSAYKHTITLPQGVYMVRLKCGDDLTTTKVVVR